MPSLVYTSGTGGISVPLDGPDTYAGTAAGIRGREWGYSLGYMSLSGVTRSARECSLTVAFADEAEADRLRRVADRDMLNGTPGSLSAVGWEQRAYIVKCAPGTIAEGWHDADLTVVLLDGVWRKGHTEQYMPSHAADGVGDSLDLPYDLPYDLGAPSARQYIEAGEWGAAPLKAVVYGPCINPAFRIAGNRYAVDATVQDGGRIEIDPLASPRRVTIVNADGSTADAFPRARRGDGLGGGEYIFQPLPPGRHEIEWDGSFGLDLTWYEEEGEPPWS